MSSDVLVGDVEVVVMVEVTVMANIVVCGVRCSWSKLR